ncbi:hypothetical protein COY51_05870 [Candidatus Desantisbacteria bacterium CG_4_10_14_0_8_um_filter_39_17]|uniref:Metallo-beta-lactamase domain-containing protein n=1 Tax=Candidatus Desantisbacteria bacterium CG_4_10_14_0_8_um_filter_39_17 TaxID=1974542 RepID=A0A2H9PA59_9BACT|nr:MAG: hypothetical protein COY51_05870 [Candidatus Desantisbacteria bacterium CG_4_10_14_0_8_um_filter_39_17]
MKFIIHRGTHEIGGSCVEVFSESGSRIVIDIGMPLTDKNGEKFDINKYKELTGPELVEKKILPDIHGFYKWDKEHKVIDGLLISHPHIDHYGFLVYLNPEIKYYLGEDAKKLIDITAIFTRVRGFIKNYLAIEDRKSFEIGDFKITPYLVDHSAFDAYAFLIEADGKKLFYSGDFRGHGRKGILFRRFLKIGPDNVDVLLLEGTMLGGGRQVCETEEKVQLRIQKILKERKNIVFFFASSQNIDRLVSAYKACLKTDSIFVIDLYTAFILHRLKKETSHIPQFDWDNIRVKFFKSHADSLARSGNKESLYLFNRCKIEMPEINAKKDNILMLQRDNSIFPSVLKHIKNIMGATIIYSIWEGYLTEKFKEFCAQKGLNIEKIHTSGHAPIETLERFKEKIKPTITIPIHTMEPKRYKNLFGRVHILEDGMVYDVNEEVERIDMLGNSITRITDMVDDSVRIKAKKSDWKTLPMPKLNTELRCDKFYTNQQIEKINLGLKPIIMEDKWFIYRDKEWLYMYRSWTGHLIYKVHFVPEENGERIDKIVINRDKTQYLWQDDKKDLETVSRLIDHLIVLPVKNNTFLTRIYNKE